MGDKLTIRNDHQVEVWDYDSESHSDSIGKTTLALVRPLFTFLVRPALWDSWLLGALKWTLGALKRCAGAASEPLGTLEYPSVLASGQLGI